MNEQTSEGYPANDVRDDGTGESGDGQVGGDPGRLTDIIGDCFPDAEVVDLTGGNPGGKRRGRPPGSGKGTSGTAKRGANAAERAEWRENVAFASTILVKLGFSGFGRLRGARYRKYSPQLEKSIASIWDVQEEAAYRVGAPIAAYAEQTLPDRAKKVVGACAGPAAIIGGIADIAQHCIESEKRLVAEWQASNERRTSSDSEPEIRLPGDPVIDAGAA